MKSSYDIGRVFGIPIRVHITLVLCLPIIAMQFSRAFEAASLFWGLIMAVGLFASVALHELGHSVVALRKGCRVRQILLLPIGGIAQMEQLPSRPADEFHIAIAGPAVSFVLALAGWFGSSLFVNLGLPSVAFALFILGLMNLMLVLFNMLPSFPMDGGRIFRAWMTPRVGRVEATRIASKIGRFMAILFGIYAIFHFNMFLLIIAVFIYMSAGAEYRMVLMQQRFTQRPQGSWGIPSQETERANDEIEVGPPPYARTSSSRKGNRTGVFEELFNKWK